MNPMVLDPNSVISGSFGKLYDKDGNWLTNVYKVEATIDLGFEDVKRAGTRWVGKKLVSLEGSGSFSGYMVSSEFVEAIGVVADDSSSPFTTELVVELSDPESVGLAKASGTYKVRLKEVKFDKIPIVSYETGSLVEEEYSFSFAGYEVIKSLKI